MQDHSAQDIATKDVFTEDGADVKARVERLERRLGYVEDRLQQETLRPVRALAEEDNRWPSSYSGFIDLMERSGVPKRTRGGGRKEEGSRRTTYVSMFDLEEKC
jgi:hypothetical protein